MTADDRDRKLRRRIDGAALLLVLSLAPVGGLHAQGNPNQFGGQDRANAISKMIVLGVQQGISSLPPTSAQSFAYQFDHEAGTWVRSARLGPTVFRSAQTIGVHNLSLLAGVSYFELADTFGPVNYLVDFKDTPNRQGDFFGVVAFGASADVKVTVMNLSATYGLTSRVELTLNLPVVVVDAQASQASSTSVGNASLPPSQAVVEGVPGEG